MLSDLLHHENRVKRSGHRFVPEVNDLGVGGLDKPGNNITLSYTEAKPACHLEGSSDRLIQ